MSLNMLIRTDYLGVDSYAEMTHLVLKEQINALIVIFIFSGINYRKDVNNNTVLHLLNI